MPDEIDPKKAASLLRAGAIVALPTETVYGLGRDAVIATLALDLRIALHELGAITGAITNEDVLGQIFSRFCIGK